MSDYLGYQGKRVVVSGCFSGMGEATARILLSLGAEVHGLDFRESTLDLASFRTVDLRDPASIDAAVDSLDGKVDALFNCAGLPQTSSPLDVMKVNYIGTRYLTEKVVPLMAKGGAIASISSTGGLGWNRRVPVLMGMLQIEDYAESVKWCEDNAETVQGGYPLSKEAIIVWTMLTSARLIQQGIRINCTLPGPTETPMMKQFESASPVALIDFMTKPINRRSTPDEQAAGLIFLNSPVASYMNGVVLPVDGGFMGASATGQIDMAEMAAAAKR